MKSFKKIGLKWWQIGLMAIGVIAIISALFQLFFITTPTRSDTVMLSSPVTTADDSLINTLSHLVDSPVVQGGDIEILNNGDEFFPRLYADIEEAKSSIHISTYIWKPGTVSDEMLARLTKKAQEGVKVRIILDGFGAKSLSKKDIEMLQDAGAQVNYFQPAKIGTLTKYHKRNHARAIMIDEKIGYTGGMAIGDYWIGNAQDKDHWRDMMFRMTGAQAAQPQKTFMALWELTGGEVLVPVSLPQEKSGAVRSINITNLTPDEDIEQLSVFLITSINAAQQSISIATPYMILDDRMQNALYGAKQRGVDVKILVPGEIIDSKLVQSASQSYYKTLLEHGIELYEYNPTMLHSKMIVIDGKWSMIGSANIDTRSTFFNVENLVGIDDVAFGGKLQSIFEKDLEHATAITLEEWKKRSLLRKFLEPLCSLIDKQL